MPASRRSCASRGSTTGAQLRRRSAADTEWFWDAVVRHLGIEFFTPYERVVDTSRGPEWATWFGGGTINLTYNCVDRHAVTTPDHLAVIAESEDGDVAAGDLRRAGRAREPAGQRAARAGRRPGRPVGLYLPMGIEVVVAFYAVCKIGAIAVPIFSGFAATAVAARLDDAEAAGLITADAVPRRGRPVVDEGDRRRGRWPHVPGVRHVIVARPPRHRPADAGRPRPPLARAGRPPERRAGRAGARSRDADDGHLHLRHHRHGRRAPSTSTAASWSRSPRSAPSSATSTRTTSSPG